MLTKVMGLRDSFPKLFWIPFEKRTKLQHPVRRSISVNCACRFCSIGGFLFFPGVDFIEEWIIAGRQNAAPESIPGSYNLYCDNILQ